jgi:hypothetical protein
MYLLRVSRAKPNGLDDEYVMMGNITKNSIDSFNRLFPKDKEYLWERSTGEDFIKFKIKGLSDLTDTIRIYVEILDYRWGGVSKKMIDEGNLSIMTYRMNDPIEFDLAMCSIRDYEIIVDNRHKFLLPSKPRKFQSEFKIYTGREGFDNLRSSSYLFSDEVDDSLMSYSTLLGTNRLR